MNSQLNLVRRLRLMKPKEAEAELAKHAKKSCRKCYGRGFIGQITETEIQINLCKCVKGE